MESIDVFKELIKFKERLDRFEGGVSAMVLKDQEDDKKLAEILVLKDELQKSRIRESLQEVSNKDNFTSLQKSINQVGAQLSDICGRVKQLEQLIIGVTAIAPRVQSLEKNQETHTYVLAGLEEKLWDYKTEFFDELGVVRNSIFSYKNTIKEEMEERLHNLASNKEVLRVRDELCAHITDVRNQLIEVFGRLEKEINTSKSNIVLHKKETEQFKHNVAEQLSKAVALLKDHVDTQIAPIKESGLKRQLDVFKADLENLRTDDDIKAHKTDIFEREIDNLKKKLEKVFLLLKKQELSKE